MDDNKSITVKISMPIDFAEEFIRESDEHFMGARYLNILYKDRFLKALLNSKDKDIQDAILKVREEMFIYLKHKQFWEK